MEINLTNFGQACQIPPSENYIEVAPWRGTSQYRSEQVLTGEVTPTSDVDPRMLLNRSRLFDVIYLTMPSEKITI